MKKIVDYYRLLGIEIDSTDEEVRAACSRIISKNSLEGISDKNSEEYKNRRLMLIATKKIYSVLGHPAKRKAYDEKLIEYRADADRKAKYLNAYKEDSADHIAITDDFSDKWQGIIHAKQGTENGSDTNIAEAEKKYPAEASTEQDDLLDMWKAISKAKKSGTDKQQENSTDSNMAASNLTAEPYSVKGTNADSLSDTVKEPVISEPVVTPSVNDKGAQNSAVKSNKTKNKEKQPLQTKATSRKSTKAETKAPNKEENKKSKSSGNLDISSAFMNELLKLKIRPNDTIPKYILRNKWKFLGAVVITAAIGISTIPNSSAKKDSGITFTTPSTTIAQDEYDLNTQPTLDYTANLTEEEELEQTITLYRVHRIASGDTLSKFSADSNTTMEEIRRINNMSDDTVKLGTYIMIPYIIDAEDLHIYTNSAPYNPNITLEKYAAAYETDPETLCRINPEAIVYTDDYHVLTDSLLVPNFITKNEYKEKKAEERNVNIKN